jgi:hypothetical protein
MTIAALGGIAPAASAVTYEPAPPFCAPHVLKDHLAPLERLPALPSPPASGQLGFGPSSLRIQSLPALVTGAGRVGYKLYLRRKAPSIHPRWRVTTTLSRVDWHGDEVEAITRTNRRLRTIKAGRGAGVQLELDGIPAPYRVLTVFHNKAGERIGGFGFYFRVVSLIGRARLVLNAHSYGPGQTVFGRVENLGTALVNYGVPYAIERLDGTTWSKAPESPPGPWIMPLLSSAPGMSGGCDNFWIPPTMPAGRYRMVKEVEIGSVRPRDPTFLTAEFDVAP